MSCRHRLVGFASRAIACPTSLDPTLSLPITGVDDMATFTAARLRAMTFPFVYKSPARA